MRSDLLSGILEQEIHFAGGQRVIVNLHFVNESVETAGGHSAVIDAADQERHGILVERLAQFAVLRGRAIHIDRPHPAQLVNRHNLVPVAIVHAGRRIRRLFRRISCDPAASLDKRGLIVG